MTKTSVAAGSLDADRILSILGDLTRASTELKIQTALAYSRQLLNELPALKKALRSFQNTLVAVQDGLSSRDLTQVSARAEIKSANAELTSAVKSLLADVATQEDSGSDLLDLSKLSDSLLKYDVSKNELQTKLMRSHFVVATSSVVVITQPYLSQQALKSNGFSAESFEGYTILGKQIVVGLHSDYIRTQVKDKADRDGPARDATEVFDDFVDSVKLKYRNLNLMKLGKGVSWWGASWAWLIPERQFKALRACTSSGRSALNLQVRSWGLPFDR